MQRYAIVRGLIFLGALSLTFPALAQKTHQRKFDQEAMEERYDMPPAPPLIPVTSPRMVVPMDGYTSYQINVNGQGNNIVGDAANEPAMVVDPNNPNNIAVGWRQFNSVSSNFRQGGYAFSTDGGIHWTFPGVLENNVFRSDPCLAATAEGLFHYNSLEQSFFTDEFTSQNQGQSWTKLGRSEGGDKQWIAIDRTASSGHGYIYQLWDTSSPYSPAQFTRSTDGGHTWLNPPINLPSSPIFGTLDVGPNGELYLVGSDGSQPSLRFLRSTNAKNGAVTPSWDRSVFVDMGGDLVFGPNVNPGGLAGQAWIAADRSSQFVGNVYILASVDGSSDAVSVKFRRSLDGGATWQPAIRVNDDPTNQGRYHWFGTLAVAPNGRIDVCWLDTRNDPSNATSQLWYAYSTDGGVTFSKNVQISPSFNSTIGWPQQNKIGDYMAMSSDNGGANIVYPATFNGEQDIYFVRVPFGTSTETLAPIAQTVSLGKVTAGNLASLAADDGNAETVCKFFVPTQSSPFVSTLLTYQSTKSAPTAITLGVKAKWDNAGAYVIRLLQHNFATGQDDETLPETTLSGTFTVYTGTATGNLANYLDGSRQTQARVTVRQSGPSTALLPCVDFEYAQQSVTG